ncbi:hypothetical protein BH09PAT1_BH09PAT1_2190 [soil metagenome]
MKNQIQYNTPVKIIKTVFVFLTLLIIGFAVFGVLVSIPYEESKLSGNSEIVCQNKTRLSSEKLTEYNIETKSNLDKYTDNSIRYICKNGEADYKNLLTNKPDYERFSLINKSFIAKNYEMKPETEVIKQGSWQDVGIVITLLIVGFIILLIVKNILINIWMTR